MEMFLNHLKGNSWTTPLSHIPGNLAGLGAVIATARCTHLARLDHAGNCVRSSCELSAHLAGPLFGLHGATERTLPTNAVAQPPLPRGDAASAGRLFSSLAVSRKRRGFTCKPSNFAPRSP